MDCESFIIPFWLEKKYTASSWLSDSSSWSKHRIMMDAKANKRIKKLKNNVIIIRLIDLKSRAKNEKQARSFFPISLNNIELNRRLKINNARLCQMEIIAKLAKRARGPTREHNL